MGIDTEKRDHSRDFAAIKTAINRAKKVLVATHQQPDGDAIGSLLAMGLYLKSCGIEFYLFVKVVKAKPEEYRFLKRFKFLKGFELIHTELPEFFDFDTIIGLDYGAPWRLGLDTNLPENMADITFDHHEGNDFSFKVGIKDPLYPSTCDLLTDYFEAIDFPLDLNIATALYTGIITDTGSLHNLESAAYLTPTRIAKLM